MTVEPYNKILLFFNKTKKKFQKKNWTSKKFLAIESKLSKSYRAMYYLYTI
jgi:hypothetical protein